MRLQILRRSGVVETAFSAILGRVAGCLFAGLLGHPRPMFRSRSIRSNRDAVTLRKVLPCRSLASAPCADRWPESPSQSSRPVPPTAAPLFPSARLAARRSALSGRSPAAISRRSRVRSARSANQQDAWPRSGARSTPPAECCSTAPPVLLAPAALRATRRLPASAQLAWTVPCPPGARRKHSQQHS